MVKEGSGSARVLRGGSLYRLIAEDLRSAYRYGYGPDRGDDRIGFRLVRTL